MPGRNSRRTLPRLIWPGIRLPASDWQIARLETCWTQLRVVRPNVNGRKTLRASGALMEAENLGKAPASQKRWRNQGPPTMILRVRRTVRSDSPRCSVCLCEANAMSWLFRKTYTLGPLKVTFSKSGVSISLGGKGFRTGIDSKGRRRTSISVPGTGLRYQKRHKKRWW